MQIGEVFYFEECTALSNLTQVYFKKIESCIEIKSITHYTVFEKMCCFFKIIWSAYIGKICTQKNTKLTESILTWTIHALLKKYYL